MQSPAAAAGRGGTARERLQPCANPVELGALLSPALKVFVPMLDLVPFNPMASPSQVLGLQ